MTLHREDAYCPACPNPETAFRIEDVGMKCEQGDIRDGAMTIKTTRLAWEPVMLAHLETEDDEGHRRLYDQCVAALTAQGVSAEDVARTDVQRVAGWARNSLTAKPAKGRS